MSNGHAVLVFFGEVAQTVIRVSDILHWLSHLLTCMRVNIIVNNTVSYSAVCN